MVGTHRSDEEAVDELSNHLPLDRSQVEQIVEAGYTSVEALLEADGESLAEDVPSLDPGVAAGALKSLEVSVDESSLDVGDRPPAEAGSSTGGAGSPPGTDRTQEASIVGRAWNELRDLGFWQILGLCAIAGAILAQFNPTASTGNGLVTPIAALMMGGMAYVVGAIFGSKETRRKWGKGVTLAMAAVLLLMVPFSDFTESSSATETTDEGPLTFDTTNHVTTDRYEEFIVKIRLWYDGDVGGISDEGTSFPMDSGAGRYVDWELPCDTAKASSPAIEIRVRSSETGAEEVETWDIGGCGMGFELDIDDGAYSAYDIQLE